MELNSLFTELVPRLESIELAGEPEYSATPSSAASSTCRSVLASLTAPVRRCVAR
jgi:hypothetical protein